MLRRLITRIGYMLVTLIGVSIIAFALVRIAPGNPAELMLPEDATAEEIQLMEERMGLDDPLPVQYINYISGVVRGDLGYSYKFKMDVTDLIALRLPETAKLAGLAFLWSIVF